MKQPAQGSNYFASPRLLSDQRDLQVGGAVLLAIKSAAVDIAGAPEQHIPSEIHEVVLHEVRSLFQSERNKALPEYALRRVDGPRTISIRRNLVEHAGKALGEGSDLVALIGNEVDLLRAGSDRMRAVQQH